MKWQHRINITLTKMPKLLWACCLLLITAAAVAQPMQECIYTEKGLKEKKLDFAINRGKQENDVYYTEYNLSYQGDDKLAEPLKTIRIVNHKNSLRIDITIMNFKERKQDAHYTCNYSATSGLILADGSDNAETITEPYTGPYLISFTDENKTYLQVHYISKSNQAGDYTIYFDKVPETLLQKNSHMLHQLGLFNKLLAQFGQDEPMQQTNAITSSEVKSPVNKKSRENSQPIANPTPVVPQTTNNPFLTEIDNFYQKYFGDSMVIVATDSTINAEIRKRFGNSDKVMKSDEGLYQGDLSSGARQGDGMFIVNSREIYLGTFSNDNFVSGKASVKYKDGKKYLGGYLGKHPMGMGQMWYPNNEMELGIFDKAGFREGIIRKKDANGNAYFGQVANSKKEGFGFFRTPKGDVFIGVFKDDRPDNGYYSQFDDLGIKTVSRIKDGIKNPVASAEWDSVTAEIQKWRPGIK